MHRSISVGERRETSRIAGRLCKSLAPTMLHIAQTQLNLGRARPKLFRQRSESVDVGSNVIVVGTTSTELGSRDLVRHIFPTVLPGMDQPDHDLCADFGRPSARFDRVLPEIHPIGTCRPSSAEDRNRPNVGRNSTSDRPRPKVWLDQIRASQGGGTTINHLGTLFEERRVCCVVQVGWNTAQGSVPRFWAEPSLGLRSSPGSGGALPNRDVANSIVGVGSAQFGAFDTNWQHRSSFACARPNLCWLRPTWVGIGLVELGSRGNWGFVRPQALEGESSSKLLSSHTHVPLGPQRRLCGYVSGDNSMGWVGTGYHAGATTKRRTFCKMGARWFLE